MDLAEDDDLPSTLSIKAMSILDVLVLLRINIE